MNTCIIHHKIINSGNMLQSVNIFTPHRNLWQKMFVDTLFCLCLAHTFVNGYSFEENLVNSSISQATSKIVEDFYAKQSSYILFTTGYVNESNRLRQWDMVNEIVQRADGIVKFRLQEYGSITSVYSEQNNLIFIDSYEGFS